MHCMHRACSICQWELIFRLIRSPQTTENPYTVDQHSNTRNEHNVHTYTSFNINILMCIYGSMINILLHTQGYNYIRWINILRCIYEYNYYNQIPSCWYNVKNWQFWAFAFPVILRHTCTHKCLTDLHLSFVLFKICIPFASLLGFS